MTLESFPPLTAQELADLNALNIGDALPDWAGGLALDSAARLVPRMLATINHVVQHNDQMRTILTEVLVWLQADNNRRGQNYWQRMEDAIAGTVPKERV